MLRSFEAGLSLGDRITTCAIHVDEGAYTGQWRMRGTGLVKHAVCCSVLQCVTVCRSVLQCVAVCCSVLQ